jgi:hypothetical protein
MGLDANVWEQVMSDTAIVGQNVEVIQAGTGASGRSAFSWSVVIAGALAAVAVSFIFIWLGSGIGLSVTSPYGGSPSATTMTAAGAIWLLLAQTIGFTAGGYLAGRLRIRNHLPGPDTLFRDAAHGFMVWVIGAVFTAEMIVLAGMFSAGTAAVGANAASNLTGASWSSDYYVDRMFRPGAGAAPNNAAPAEQASGQTTTQNTNANNNSGRASRAEVNRILVNGISSGKLGDDDRGYLARLVSARTGMPLPEAERRVTETEKQATEAADKARKAGAFVSFWTFIALLFGAVAATLAGMLGGELRDEV